MWITEHVEIPDAVVGALSDGRLVIFAGAGVSRGAPTDLPDVRGLAEALGRSAKVGQLPDEELERYLGRVADSGFPLHQEAAARIAQAKEPNRLQRAIVQLERSRRAVALPDFLRPYLERQRQDQAARRERCPAWVDAQTA